MKSTIFLNLLASYGGQLTRALSFLNCISTHNFDASWEFVVLTSAGVLPQSLHSRFTVIELKSNYLSPSSFLFRFLWENLVLDKYLTQYKADVYLSFSHSLPLIPLSIPSVIGVSNVAPFVKYSYSSASFHSRVRLLALSFSILAAARKSTFVIALSSFCKHLLAERNISSSKIFVYPNGLTQTTSTAVDLSCLPPSLSAFGLSATGPLFSSQYILSVSNFYDYKNFRTLIQAYSNMPSDFHSSHPLVICGYPLDANYYRSISRLVVDLCLTHSIYIIPGLPADALNYLYSRSSAFIFPSLVENCPNCLLEAFRHGLPLICADTPSSREFASNSSLYFDPTSADDLTSAISHLFAYPERLDHFSKLSRQRATCYSWQLFTESVIELCRCALTN